MSPERYDYATGQRQMDQINNDRDKTEDRESEKDKQIEDNNNNKQTSGTSWFPKLKSRASFRQRLTRKIARLSSLDSTRTNSSTEIGPENWHPLTDRPLESSVASLFVHQATPLPMSLLGSPLSSSNQQQLANKSSQDTDFRTTIPRATADQTLAGDGNSKLEQQQPIQAVMKPQTIHRERPQHQEPPMTNYEDLSDDRQGMNIADSRSQPGHPHNQLHHHHQPHKHARGSLDAESSIVSDFASHSDRRQIKGARTSSSSTGGKNNQSIKQHNQVFGKRSKSPSSTSYGHGLQRKSSSSSRRRGLFGLASRLKLTRRHESIERFQLSILQSGFISLKRLDRDLQSFLPKARMSPNEFEEHVKLIRKYPVLASIEYKFANRYETYVCRHALQDENQAKNNYKKCIPYDYNRVVLRTQGGRAHSDYINASHVDSYLKPNAYIAAQGPNENTIEDFWRMVWEQKSFVIVMLTKVFDFIKVMCNQYWPVERNKPERYGNLEVTLLYEEPLADFVIRTIRLTKCRPTVASSTNKQAQQNPMLNTPDGESIQQQAEFDRMSASTSGRAPLDSDLITIDQILQDQRFGSTPIEPLDEFDVDDAGELDSDLDAGSDQEELSDEEVVVVNETAANDNPREGAQTSSIPAVRSPKFILASQANGDRYRNRQARPSSRSGPRRRSISADEVNTLINRLRPPSSTNNNNNQGSSSSSPRRRRNAETRDNSPSQRAANKRPTHLDLSSLPLRSHSDNTMSINNNAHHLGATSGAHFQQFPQQQYFQQPNCTTMGSDFLHPLFGLRPASPFRSASPAYSMFSMPDTPTTPMTPTTPGSAGEGAAGLDRGSATRRAVKKRRRVRVGNSRPVMTQFKVPEEHQLLDDEDYETYLDYGQNGENLQYETDGQLDAGTNENAGPSAGANQQAPERIIYQFHYHNWAAHTCPFVSSLLHFRRRVRICMDEMAKSGKTGPTIVHCNDGCGRTGAYLCIDANLELADEDAIYDVFNFTKKLRQSRKFLIENLEQYKFVYDTIEESMFCGKTWFKVGELHQKLKQKSQRNVITKKNEYQLEYDKICRMTGKFSIGDCAGGHRVENREKNRDVSTVPPDNFRPYLTSFQSNDSTDYINAVFVDGYTRSKEYIVTEWPLHRTMSDFWSLIYDHDCNSVILLANPLESSTYPSFLPTEKELRRKFGPVFSAEMVSYTHYQNIKSWIYTINKKIVSLTEVIAGVKSEIKTTQVFQITCWPQGHRVPTSTNALVELMNMVERWRQRTAYGPVCVVSLNGKSRAGVYCAANVAIEQVVQHGEVDVFHAVKTVRRHRPQLIENMTEYKYCYDLILHYVLHYLKQTTQSS